MQETRVLSLGREDPLEEGMATHTSILGWRIPMERGARWATVHGVTESQTRLKQLSIHACSPVKFDFLRLEKAKEPTSVEAYNRCLVKGLPTHRAQKVTKIQRS